MNVVRTLVTFSILGAMLAAPAMPQETDPPRRAARLGYVGGAVSLTPAGLQESTPAEVNRPFTSGDRFWSGADGRGELQTENAAIRFGGRASFAIQELSNQATLIRLESGTLSVRLHTLAAQEDFEVETPQFTFHINRLGAYRVDVGEKGDVVAAVRWGDADVFGSSGAPVAIPRGKQARAAGAGGPVIESARPIDQFEGWCVERDRREDLSAAAQYVSRDVPGYADLDEHGDWQQAGQYGMAWFPRNMDPDWAPYRSGHFVSAGPWGMNWVDDASWGFGPLHYGRWAKVNGVWGWVPGAAGKSANRFASRPYYAPALVAWTKFAAGVVRPGAVVGWFPLGPGEAWVPQIPASADYVARVNLSNTTLVARNTTTGTIENPDVTRANYMYRETAMTAMGQQELAAGHPVDRQYVRVPETAYAQGMVSAQPGVEATREARLGPRGVTVGAPAEIAHRPVVEHRMPGAPATPAYVRQSPVPQTGVSSSRATAGSTPKASPAALEHSGAKPAALSRTASQGGSGAKPQTPAPAANQGAKPSVLSKASKGVVGGTKSAGNALKGGTTNTQPTKTQSGKPPQAKPTKPEQP